MMRATVAAITGGAGQGRAGQGRAGQGRAGASTGTVIMGCLFASGGGAFMCPRAPPSGALTAHVLSWTWSSFANHHVPPVLHVSPRNVLPPCRRGVSLRCGVHQWHDGLGARGSSGGKGSSRGRRIGEWRQRASAYGF
jgi:hypothetical protein